MPTLNFNSPDRGTSLKIFMTKCNRHKRRNHKLIIDIRNTTSKHKYLYNCNANRNNICLGFEYKIKNK